MVEGRGAVYLIVLFTMPTLSISSNFFDEKIPRLGRLFQATGRGVRGEGGRYEYTHMSTLYLQSQANGYRKRTPCTYMDLI
jgi:hypothetical protein